MRRGDRKKNKVQPKPWQATTRQPEDRLPHQRFQRLRIDSEDQYNGTNLMAYIVGRGLKEAAYSDSDKLTLIPLSNVVQIGVDGIQTIFDTDIQKYDEFHKGLQRSMEGLAGAQTGGASSDIDMVLHPSPIVEQLPQLQKALTTFGTSMEAMRSACLEVRLAKLENMNQWLARDDASVWMRINRYGPLQEGIEEPPDCSLLRLTGLVVTEKPDRYHPDMPQIGWQGTGIDDISGVYHPNKYYDLYIPAGPDEQMPIQNVQPSAAVL